MVYLPVQEIRRREAQAIREFIVDYLAYKFGLPERNEYGLSEVKLDAAGDAIIPQHIPDKTKATVAESIGLRVNVRSSSHKYAQPGRIHIPNILRLLEEVEIEINKDKKFLAHRRKDKQIDSAASTESDISILPESPEAIAAAIHYHEQALHRLNTHAKETNYWEVQAHLNKLRDDTEATKSNERGAR